MRGRSKINTRTHTPGPVPPANTRRRPARLLVVEPDGASRETLAACATADGRFTVATAGSLAEARTLLSRRAVDLLMVAENLPDGSGLSLVSAVRAGRRNVEVLLLSERPTAEMLVTAMRAGTSDVLEMPPDPGQARERLDAALQRLNHRYAPIRRVRRLRRLCRQLNQARLDVGQQVDALCSDLVAAYQELADQMQQVVQGGEFSALIRDELDLASALKTTLEFLVSKAGRTNAAIFLPTTMDEYSLGGYVSLNPSTGPSTLLLEHLTHAVAPRIGERRDLEHLVGDDDARACLGPDAAPLAGQELIAFTARHDHEILAVITLFRDADDPFDRAALDACASVGPLLGEALARIIRIHHRHLPFDDDTGTDFAGPDAPAP